MLLLLWEPVGFTRKAGLKRENRSPEVGEPGERWVTAAVHGRVQLDWWKRRRLSQSRVVVVVAAQYHRVAWATPREKWLHVSLCAVPCSLIVARGVLKMVRLLKHLLSTKLLGPEPVIVAFGSIVLR